VKHDIPLLFWKELCQEADYPMACVDSDNKFVWVNTAYERLLGYSIIEITGKTWMSVTDQNDVGGDLASVAAVIDGLIPQYTMSKNYVHKRGYKVPVDLTVRRFPESAAETMMYFRVETPPAKANRSELQELKETIMYRINKLENNTTTNTGNTGRDRNSDTAIKVLASAFAVMVLGIAWLFYYVVIAHNGTTPKPPSQEIRP
jgi:PAS domain S-box-containing protein